MASTSSTDVRRLLVANRAEIAARVFRTCRELGIETVAVHSDADADLPFVRAADAAVRLPGSAPADTYLRTDLILEAARRTGADAIHPGYGFLSENAEFARAVIDAGLTWIGPAPESIEAMGSKVRAKQLMREAGVPILEAPESPSESDLPLLVKASAGGGGRGMRVVRRLEDLDREISAAGDEAQSAFGDGTVFVEPYVERGRHVEVQVVGDTHGDVLVLGERDCSIQRRHQKVVEESPAPDLDDTVRAAMHEAACQAALAVSYVGAGTVEFLYDPSTERFFFLEMNTRLQVEHPVTEMVFGVDLVALQIAVAEGAALRDASLVPREAPQGPGDRAPEVRAQRASKGHAIEVRLYAEDPARDWQPQSGLLSRFEIPTGSGVRLDAGFESGSEVSTYYDAMLAKVIAWAPTRRGAARLLADTLRRSRLHGLVTNRDLLVRVLQDPAFVDGQVATDFFDRTSVLESSAPTAPTPAHLLAAAVALAERDRVGRRTQVGIPVAWRNVVSQPQRTTFEAGGSEHVVEWFGTRDGYASADDSIRVVSAAPEVVVLEVGGVEARFEVSATRGHMSAQTPDSPLFVQVDGGLVSARLRVAPRFTDPADAVASGSLLAPMPGSVVAVKVDDGAEVGAGDPVLVLEAMKMQHTITAPTDGVVSDLVSVGAQVAAGDVLAVVSTSSTDEVEETA